MAQSPAIAVTIEIRIADVGLPAKLSAIGAALEATRLAHRDTMSTACWAALHRAESEIADAMLVANRQPSLPEPHG